MERKAFAVWNGTGKDGIGNISTQSGVLSGVKYTFAQRFENEPGTNPEELITAALASCFTMKLAFLVVEGNLKPERLETNATFTMEKEEKGWVTKGIHLEVKGKVPGANKRQFSELVERAKNECPMSKIISTNKTVEGILID